MIDWYSVFGALLWVFGLAMVLAAVSFAWYESASSSRSLRSALATPRVETTYMSGFVLFCLGMLARVGVAWWEGAIWLALAGVFAVQAWAANRRRHGQDVDLRTTLRSWTQGDRPLVIGLIVLGMLLALLYALVIRPWMQPDEPRHFEVALHVARLGKPIVYYPDLVLEWEQEIIRDMENQSFWWYGYSLIGWDPENLPQSFVEIWGLLNSRAFFQLPLYYALAGGLLHQWGDALPLSEAVIRLRMFGVLLYGLSLWGIYRVARELFPGWRQIALVALALAALWPSHLAASAAVNNDPLAEVVVVWSVFFAIRLLRFGPQPKTVLWFSLLILLTLFTKRSGFSVLILLLALPLWAWRQYTDKRSPRQMLKPLAAGLIALIIMAALFFVIQGTVRNWIPRSFLESLRSGVFWQALLEAPLADSVQALLRTFWGWFGWLRLPLPEPVYLVGGVITVGALLFVGVGFLQMFSKRFETWQRQGLFLLFSLLFVQFALTFGKDIVYGLYEQGSLPQARYMYPALVAFVIPLLVGLAWAFKGRWSRLALPVAIVILLAYNIYILAFVLYPFFWL